MPRIKGKKAPIKAKNSGAKAQKTDDVFKEGEISVDNSGMMTTVMRNLLYHEKFVAADSIADVTTDNLEKSYTKKQLERAMLYITAVMYSITVSHICTLWDQMSLKERTLASIILNTYDSECRKYEGHED